jgi:tryptophan halogenase
MAPMTDMTTPIRNLLIVGGGTAGWLTAAFLARTLGARHEGGVRITLVESTDIPAIGVGEGTFPSIRGTLAAIGLDERTFLRECQATYKQGVRFDDWGRVPPSGTTHHPAPGDAQRHTYFHPFSQPSQRPGGPELLPYWLTGAAGPGVRFAEAATLQHRVVAEGRAPRRATDADYQGPLNHAYHLDAGRFATLLCRHAQSLGVRRLVDTVEQVEVDGHGRIAGVLTRANGTLAADLYVDCTGFRATLIGAALGSPFRSVRDVLFTDRAIALQVPYDHPDAPIVPCTVSTAHEAGWTWDIGLQTRRGIGYVYSSRHTTDDEAERVLRAYVGPAAEGLTARRLVLDCGYRERQWIGNCVAVGLSAGFLEPLESSGIGLIEAAAYLIGFLFPFDGRTEPAARFFNRQMTERFERIVDFIKLHYCLNGRMSQPFWRDNAAAASIPDSLEDLLDRWRARPPHRLDFVTDIEMYPPSSWQYVLYGMDFPTQLAPAMAATLDRVDEARREFDTLRQVAGRACADLPLHRDLLRQLVG